MCCARLFMASSHQVQSKKSEAVTVRSLVLFACRAGPRRIILFHRCKGWLSHSPSVVKDFCNSKWTTSTDYGCHRNLPYIVLAICRAVAVWRLCLEGREGMDRPSSFCYAQTSCPVSEWDSRGGVGPNALEVGILSALIKSCFGPFRQGQQSQKPLERLPSPCNRLRYSSGNQGCCFNALYEEETIIILCYRQFFPF